MPYCSLSDLKSALNVTDTVDDVRLNIAINSASGWIESYCGRTFNVASGTATRDYTPTGRLEPLPIDDATSIVSVAIDDDLDGSFATVLTPVDYQPEPLNQSADGVTFPFNRLRPIEDGYWPAYRQQATVRVQATFGWEEVPFAINQAAILQSMRLFKRLDSPLGVAGFGDFGVMRVSRFVDPDVEMLLSPYRRHSF